MEGMVSVHDEPLSVEHILPQHWIEHWPLADGSDGLSQQELWAADAGDPRAEATHRRNAALQTLGNLTILRSALNSAASNNPWKHKKPELLLHSLLPINQQLQPLSVWDEEAIAKRSDDLFEMALKLWPKT